MKTLQLSALEVSQGANRKLYTFAIDGKQVPKFASVTRAKRGAAKEFLGYQRPEIQGHIAQIRKYIEADDPLLPNSVVVAFDDRVTFKSDEAHGESGVRVGRLTIPLAQGTDAADYVGWIVDGQQRLAAIGQAAVTSFPVVVNAFIAGDIDEQRSQFILVNSTRPLPQSLIHELLPLTAGVLPAKWAGKQRAAALLQRLNDEDDSPFRGIIKTATNPDGIVQDNSILRMVGHSLKDGVLYSVLDEARGVTLQDVDLSHFKSYWRAVGTVFPAAWARPPRKSRLMHGVGIVSMGCLMDMMAGGLRDVEQCTETYFYDELGKVAERCCWTSGVWDFGNGVRRNWNEIENTTRDTSVLTSYLLKEYRAKRFA